MNGKIQSQRLSDLLEVIAQYNIYIKYNSLSLYVTHIKMVNLIKPFQNIYGGKTQ